MRPTVLKLTAGFLLFCGLVPVAKSQSTARPINVVTTAVPFLRISPDARAGGMGDIGVATSADAASGFWNMGKVAFNESQAGVLATYTPWLKNLVNDVYLASLSGYYKLDEMQAVNLGLRYFSLGNIQFTDGVGNSWGNGKPREFSIDLGYSRKLSDKLGLGIALRYINSDLTNGVPSGSTTYKAGNSVAGDIGFYYNGHDEAGDGFAFGATLTNLGSKISYTGNADSKDFIPANLGLGSTWTKNFNEDNKLTFGLDINKLLVPTPPADLSDPNAVAEYRKKGVVSSWFSSFGDAPDGFKEELKEFQVSAGAEFWYKNQFALRAGYFFEDKTKGNRRYFTTGIGVKYNIFGLNFSYLLPSGSGVTQNPLSNTLRFSILFDLDPAAGEGGEE
ncbi:type IX secretion system outer membrane channel protein PorV [Terrimonas pollutisoli]|uniref:type IX secretion system outer membrane channel protein PorV n=1 Tax=Terrimonas pollutisoli TaxID=3034147 RepID=UPI0023ED3FA1|nr:type IX secretion system outer membrane channel protein PorV [Terrimonas sp. H1YJ31]